MAVRTRNNPTSATLAYGCAAHEGEFSVSAIDRRGESRTGTSIAAELSSIEESILETTSTQNVSPHGACVLTRAAWQLGAKVIVKLLYSSRFIQGEVMYCDSRSENQFVVGLKLRSRLTA